MPKVNLVEVGLRDGLQNEKVGLDLPTRMEFARRLMRSGLKRIEIGAFVSPKWVPTMAYSGELIQRALTWQQREKNTAQLSALIPNTKGLEAAIASGIREVAIFAATSETFSRRNINCSIAESFERFRPVVALAKKHKIKVRGYLSTCFGCPYEGPVKESQVIKVAQKMIDLGVFEISVGDTIGVANPKQVRSLTKKLLNKIDKKKIAMHFHDTRGVALANILASLEMGIHTFDASLGGLGGCPYAEGASGNVATEDVVYMLEGMGYKTGVHLESLIKTNHWLEKMIGHPLPSRVSKAGLIKGLY